MAQRIESVISKMDDKDIESIDSMTPTDILEYVDTTKRLEVKNENSLNIRGSIQEYVDPMKSKRELSQIRNEHIIKYYSTGMTTSTIMNMVNSKAKAKGWLEIKEDTVRAIISDHYKKRRELFRGVDGDENEKAMQDAMLDQQEKFLEKLVISYNESEKNGAFKNTFEKIQMADLIHRMRQQYIENRNWNESRKNPLVIENNNTFEVNLFQNSGNKMIMNGKSSGMEDVISALKARLHNSNEDSVEADWEEEII